MRETMGREATLLLERNLIRGQNVRDQLLPASKALVLGRLTDAVGADTPDKRATWEGTISLDDRLRSGELTEELIDKITGPDYVNRYYVRLDPLAPEHCVDERGSSKARNQLTAVDSAVGIGPQVPGGVLNSTLCYRVIRSMIKPQEANKANFLEDMQQVRTLMLAAGLVPANHHGSNAQGAKIDCAAADKAELIMPKLLVPEAASQIIPATNLVMGINIKPEVFADITAALEELRVRSPKYAERQKEADEVLGSSSESLLGAHNGIMFNFNRREGWGFDRDRWVWDHRDLDVGAFNYDPPHSFEVGEAIFGVSELSTYFAALQGMYTIATGMQITDGSLRGNLFTFA